MAKSSKTKSVFITIALIISLTALWFVAVEKSWYIEGCQNCYFQSYVFRYKVFGITIHQTTQQYNTILRDVLIDLGVPCPHKGQFSLYKAKYYGLIIPMIKDNEETEILIGNDSWYTPAIAAKVKQLGKDNPEFAKEFYHQMIDLQNYEYWGKLFKEAGINIATSQQNMNEAKSVFTEP